MDLLKYSALPEWQPAVEALNRLALAVEREGLPSNRDEWLEVVVTLVDSLPRLDCCSDCQASRMYAPLKTVQLYNDAGDPRGVKCVYRCEADHLWTCSWGGEVSKR